jgi:hypothetical protein
VSVDGRPIYAWVSSSMLKIDRFERQEFAAGAGC